jgi:hypothetical protein
MVFKIVSTGSPVDELLQKIKSVGDAIRDLKAKKAAKVVFGLFFLCFV